MRRLKLAARYQAGQDRLAVTPFGGTFRCGAAILLKFEQGELAALLRPPSLKLLASQFDKALPAIGVAVDQDGAGFCHDGNLDAARKGPPLAERP